MTRALSADSVAKLKVFLAAPASDYDPDKVADPYSKILAWAQDSEYGGLPEPSARGFASWLSNVWVDWTEEEGITVQQLLDGAVTDWCGGREMPS